MAVWSKLFDVRGGAALLVGLVMATAACGERDGRPEGEPATGTAEGVMVLAKAPGWRSSLGGSGTPFAILEIAADRATAERAWSENVPNGLPELGGTPDRPGIYGSVEDIDFDRQIVVVWSSGESGSCPEWLADVQTDENGVVEVERRHGGTSPEPAASNGLVVVCTGDYRPYRMVLAVDRIRLPDLADLPSRNIRGVPEGAVVPYPYEP